MEPVALVVVVVSKIDSDGDIDRPVQYVEVDLTKVGESVIKSFVQNLNLGSAVDSEVLKVTFTCNICNASILDILQVVSTEKCMENT